MAPLPPRRVRVHRIPAQWRGCKPRQAHRCPGGAGAQPNCGRRQGGATQQALDPNRRRRRAAVASTGRGGSQSAPCSRDPSPGRDDAPATGPPAPGSSRTPSLSPVTFGRASGEPDSVPGAATSAWRCPTCTFINDAAAAKDRCATCGSVRPRAGRSRRLTLAQQRGLVRGRGRPLPCACRVDCVAGPGPGCRCRGRRRR